MTQIEKINDYFVFQIMRDGFDMLKFVNDFPDLLIGRSVYITSFDGDSMNLTKEECKRGWMFDENEVASISNMSKSELAEDIFANCYDEWYLFASTTNFKFNHQLYVSYSGFSLFKSNNDRLSIGCSPS
jgi:hypothetical protein